MEVAIRKMGNSQGVLIPKPILAQVGLEGTADLQVRDGVIEIRPARRNPREGWATTQSVLPSTAAMHWSGPRWLTRATPIWSGDENRRHLAGAA